MLTSGVCGRCYSYLQYRPAENQALFWSGVPIASDTFVDILNHASLNQTTLEFTHGGSLLHGLCFCGSATVAAHPTGWDTGSCPWEGAMFNYWAAASIAFAKGVTGVATALVQPDPVVFGRGSFFELFEVPNLDRDKATGTFTVNVLTNPEYPAECCDSGSVAQLQQSLRTQ